MTNNFELGINLDPGGGLRFLSRWILELLQKIEVQIANFCRSNNSRVGSCIVFALKCEDFLFFPDVLAFPSLGKRFFAVFLTMYNPDNKFHLYWRIGALNALCIHTLCSICDQHLVAFSWKIVYCIFTFCILWRFRYLDIWTDEPIYQHWKIKESFVKKKH